MLGALLYLRLTSLKNIALSRLRRLKQPKYFLGAVAGIAYIYFIFSRQLSGGSTALAGLPAGLPGGLAPTFDFNATLSVFGALVLLVIVLFTWALPKEKPGLPFLGSRSRISFSCAHFPAAIDSFSSAGSAATHSFFGGDFHAAFAGLEFFGRRRTYSRVGLVADLDDGEPAFDRRRPHDQSPHR